MSSLFPDFWYFCIFFSRAGDLKHHERYFNDMLTLWCTNELWMGIFLYKLYFASLLFPFHFSSISESLQLSVVEERRKTDGCAGVLYDELRGIGSGWNVVEWQKLELILLDGFLISLLRFLLCLARGFIGSTATDNRALNASSVKKTFLAILRTAANWKITPNFITRERNAIFPRRRCHACVCVCEENN